jgi:hypothetical protein
MIFIFSRANNFFKKKFAEVQAKNYMASAKYPKRNFSAEISPKSQFPNSLSLAIEVTLSALVMKTSLLAYLCHLGYQFLHFFCC